VPHLGYKPKNNVKLHNSASYKFPTGEKIRAPLREEGPEDLGCAVREERVDPDGTERQSKETNRRGKGWVGQKIPDSLGGGTKERDYYYNSPEMGITSSRRTKVRDLSSRSSFQIAAVSCECFRRKWEQSIHVLYDTMESLS
jgi:hypothetical protein